MHLITQETTLTEFSSRDNWLIEDPQTGALYHMKMGHLNGNKHFMYIAQEEQRACPTYIRYSIRGNTIVESKEQLLVSIQTKRFILG